MGKFVVGDGKQVLPHQLGDPEGLGHIGDGVFRIPGRTFGESGDDLLDQCINTLARLRRDREVRRAVKLVGGPGELGDDLLGRCDVGLVHDDDRVSRHLFGHESITRTDRSGGVDHHAHHVDTVGGIGCGCVETLPEQRAGLMDTGRVDEDHLHIGSVQHTADL